MHLPWEREECIIPAVGTTADFGQEILLLTILLMVIMAALHMTPVTVMEILPQILPTQAVAMGAVVVAVAVVEAVAETKSTQICTG